MRSIANWLNNINLCKNTAETHKLICSNSFQLLETIVLLQKAIFLDETLYILAGNLTEVFLSYSALKGINT